MIILVPFTDDDTTTQTSTAYNFMFDNDLGLKLRNAALRYYLKDAKLSKAEIRSLNSANDKNFLIAILKDRHVNRKVIIRKLYELF